MLVFVFKAGLKCRRNKAALALPQKLQPKKKMARFSLLHIVKARQLGQPDRKNKNLRRYLWHFLDTPAPTHEKQGETGVRKCGKSSGEHAYAIIASSPTATDLLPLDHHDADTHFN